MKNILKNYLNRHRFVYFDVTQLNKRLNKREM